MVEVHYYENVSKRNKGASLFTTEISAIIFGPTTDQAVSYSSYWSNYSGSILDPCGVKFRHFVGPKGTPVFLVTFTTPVT